MILVSLYYIIVTIFSFCHDSLIVFKLLSKLILTSEIVF